MTRYRVMATKCGYATIMADSEEEALEIMQEMDETEFDWNDIDTVEILYEMSC